MSRVRLQLPKREVMIVGPAATKLELESRGFGGLIPYGPAKNGMGDSEALPGKQFSYFSYPILGQRDRHPVKLFDKTWAAMPIDGIWTYVRQYDTGWAGTCMLHWCENPDGRPVCPNSRLARHWAPIAFTDLK